METPNQETIDKILSTKIEYEDTKMFFHCEACLTEYQESGQDKKYSPQEFMEYEAGVVPFEYPDGRIVGIFTLWCKRCKRKVWDSRHLQPWI